MKDRKFNAALAPEDLTQGLPEYAALALALEAVQSVDWPEFKWHGPTPGPVLETLLTYAYARGVYISADIEAACREDAAFRYCCAREFPAAQELRQFRRAFKPWIEQSLAAFCEHLLRVDRQSAASEAARRLLKAIRLDSAVSEV